MCIGLGFGYLSLLTDAYSKLIVGYCLHPLLTVEGSLKALEIALQSEQPRSAFLIHHSDRGSQYGSFAYIQRLPISRDYYTMATRARCPKPAWNLFVNRGSRLVFSAGALPNEADLGG